MKKSLRPLSLVSALAFVLVVAASGCSTFRVQKDRMASVKKVAIIGFGVEQERTNDLKISWTSGGEGWSAGTESTSKGTVFQTGQASHIGNVYGALGQQLEKDLGLKVIPAAAVAASAPYRAAADQERATARWVPMNTVPIDFFGLPGIASPEKSNRFSAEERQQIMKALGVDALAVAVVRLHFERNDQLAIGSFTVGSYIPSAQTTFSLYDAQDDKAIWTDFMVSGGRLDSGVFQASGVTNEEILYRKAVSASELSFHQLTDRYRKEVAAN